jgi:hypothetical protein
VSPKLKPQPHEKIKEGLSLWEQERFNMALFDLRKLYGLPPYDGADNPCRADGYFAKGIERDTPPAILAHAKEAIAKEKDDWEAFRRRYIKRWKLK